MKHVLTFGLLIPTAGPALPHGDDGFSDTAPFQHQASKPDCMALVVAALAMVAQSGKLIWVHK